MSEQLGLFTVEAKLTNQRTQWLTRRTFCSTCPAEIPAGEEMTIEKPANGIGELWMCKACRPLEET